MLFIKLKLVLLLFGKQNYLMNSLKQPIFLILLAFLTSTVNAQYKLDFGLNLGVANYLGDVGGGDGEPSSFIADMQFTQTRPSFGGFVRYKILGGLSASLHLNYVRIQNADSLSENFRRNARNISFRNNMFETALRAEYTFFKVADFGGRGYYRTDMSFYTFAGAGFLIHNPQAQYNGDWVNLRDYKTEGPENAYGIAALTLPVGMGVNVTLKKKFRIGFEVGWRFTNTDYLDDTSKRYSNPEFIKSEIQAALVSPTTEASFARASELWFGPGEVPAIENFQAGSDRRGNPDNNDGYLVVNFSLSYVIRGQSNFSRSRYSFISARKRTTRGRF